MTSPLGAEEAAKVSHVFDSEEHLSSFQMRRSEGGASL